MIKNYGDIAFTQTVKDVQTEQGSREVYARLENVEKNKLTAFEKEFIEARDMFYMATSGENNWPYVQFRGGPKGFLKVLSESQIAYADFKGNMQYISTGNMTSNNKVALILMDYTSKKRMKIWAETEIVDADDPMLKGILVNDDYYATVERYIVMNIKAYDWNCPQHITSRFSEEELSALLKSGAIKLDKNLLEGLLKNANEA